MTREDFIKSLIKSHGYTLKAFAQQISMPYTTLLSILNGSIGGAAMDNVLKICHALNVRIEELDQISNTGHLDRRSAGRGPLIAHPQPAAGEKNRTKNPAHELVSRIFSYYSDSMPSHMYTYPDGYSTSISSLNASPQPCGCPRCSPRRQRSS